MTDLLAQRPHLIEAHHRMAPQRHARAYLAAFVFSGVASVLLFFGALALLLALDRLPPPPVAGTWCIDSRFAWLRHEPRWKQASVIAVGSSATWRNLDFEVVPSEMKHRGVFNAAPCFLTFNQIRYLVEYLLRHNLKPVAVLSVLTPRDFEGCSRNRTEFFDPQVADDYLKKNGSAWWLYFRNFRFKDIFFHAVYAEERRREMNYDAFGSGPLTRAAPDAGRPFRPEARCYSELTQLARVLDSKGIQYIAVTFPIMPSWADRYDPTGTTQAQFRLGTESALSATKAILVDGMTRWRVPDSAFTDPVHLQWPETAAFTQFVWREARRQGAILPPLTQDEVRDSSSSTEILVQSHGVH